MDPIQMSVCYSGGGPLAAVFLCAYGNVIRLAIDGWEDVAEFRLVNAQWLSEHDEPVEIVSNPHQPKQGGTVTSACWFGGVNAAPAAEAWVN